MYTKFGPEAKNGDYVLVVHSDYNKNNATTYIAKVYKNKAYTGIRKRSAEYDFIHKIKAEIVISDSVVPEEIKKLIDKDIKLHNEEVSI